MTNYEELKLYLDVKYTPISSNDVAFYSIIDLILLNLWRKL